MLTPQTTDDGVSESTSDCEIRDDWGLEQEVNAWSSMAYVVAGVVLILEIRRARLPRAVWGLAVAAVAEGFGSLLYHGTASDVGQFLHDVPLIGALGFVAGWHAGRLWGRSDPSSLIGLAIGSALAAALWLWAPGATNLAVAVAVVVIVASSIVAHRRAMAGVWSLPILGLGVVAIAMWALGTPDSPWCDPQAWLQPHGVWHVLTAVFIVAWVDAAYEAVDPDHAPRLFRRFTDRTLGLAARGLVLGFHRSVDVAFRERLPRTRPTLIVANHGNGFVDPVVVAGVLGHLPRFLGKAALWRVVVARPFLGLAGVLPVYRTADGDRASNNGSVFEACHRELARGAQVAIFPEGTTGDRAGLEQVKSGAARIALGALPLAPDVVIVPIGMAYENKVETRSRATVMFGEPIEVAEFVGAGLGPDGEPSRADARALTDQITRSLGAVSPRFASVDEREVLRASAREQCSAIGERSEPRFGETEIVARRIAATDTATRQPVVDAYRDFASRLHLIGITARQLRAERVPIPRLILSALALVVAGTLLATVTAIHVPALALVVIGTGLVRSTATKGTVRLLLGLVTMLGTWIVAGTVLGDGWAAVGWGVAVAAGGAVALVVWPPLIEQVVLLFGRLRVRDRIGLLPPVLESRKRLIEAVRASIGDDDV